MCKLNDYSLTILKRIKAHCLMCSPDKPLNCNGKVSNPEPHICPLWEYRLGKNPKRSGINAKTQHLNRFKFSKHTANEPFIDEISHNRGEEVVAYGYEV